MKLASRVSRVTPSLTLVIDSLAKEMKKNGEDVCSFSAGEPDFDTPEPIKAAAKKALDEGKTRYGPAAGLPELREAIASRFREENGLNYSAENVIVTNGGKQSLYNLMVALIEEGDEVIVPAPYWLSYPEMVTLAGGKSVIVNPGPGEGYKITPERLKGAITEKTKLFVLNSPSNPTGIVYSPQEIEALARVVVEADIWVVSDEIYEKILYDGAVHRSIASFGEGIFSRAIVCNGFAKAYAMTGWRVGYAAGNRETIAAMTAIQGHSTSNVCTFAQYGALAALTGPRDSIEIMVEAFTARRKFVLEKVRSLPGLTCPTPDGAFYVFVNIAATGLNSRDFCKELLETYKVAAIPGIAFGADDCIRLSYATGMETIEKGLDRLERFVRSL